MDVDAVMSISFANVDKQPIFRDDKPPGWKHTKGQCSICGIPTPMSKYGNYYRKCTTHRRQQAPDEQECAVSGCTQTATGYRFLCFSHTGTKLLPNLNDNLREKLTAYYKRGFDDLIERMAHRVIMDSDDVKKRYFVTYFERLLASGDVPKLKIARDQEKMQPAGAAPPSSH